MSSEDPNEIEIRGSLTPEDIDALVEKHGLTFDDLLREGKSAMEDGGKTADVVMIHGMILREKQFAKAQQAITVRKTRTTTTPTRDGGHVKEVEEIQAEISSGSSTFFERLNTLDRSSDAPDRSSPPDRYDPARDIVADVTGEDGFVPAEGGYRREEGHDQEDDQQEEDRVQED